MGIRKTRELFLAGLAVLLLVGCGSQDTGEGEGESGAVAAEVPDTDTRRGTREPTPEPVRAVPEIGTSAGGDRRVLILPLPDSNRTEELQGLFYFDFDQAIVKRQGHAELNKHAQFLGSNPRMRIRLEGHADERGTREYNLALGERRANAIRGYLVRQGASRSQIEVISFGEEKPVRAGKDERSYALNRRVEIVYR